MSEPLAPSPPEPPATRSRLQAAGSALGSLRELVLGETWALPAGVGLLLGIAALLDSAAPSLWHRLGGAVLTLGVVAVLLATTRPPPPRR